MMSSDALFSVTKTFGHERGLSCAFRQWRARSHCSKLHGYALSFEVELIAKTLDARNWVYDFGCFGRLKTELEYYFDHTVAVDPADPFAETFTELDAKGLINLRIMPDGVGCERFAEFVAALIEAGASLPLPPAVKLRRVTVREHAGNAATYYTGE